MEQNLAIIHQILEKLVGLHRQMMDVVRSEKEAILGADLNRVQEATHHKEALIEEIKKQEALRLEQVAQIAVATRKPLRDITVQSLIMQVQTSHPKLSEQLRSSMNALLHLVGRIRETSQYNLELLERSLKHVDSMKMNVLGEAVPHSNTYGSQGQPLGHTSGARLISREA